MLHASRSHCGEVIMSTHFLGVRGERGLRFESSRASQDDVLMNGRSGSAASLFKNVMCRIAEHLLSQRNKKSVIQVDVSID